MADYCGSADGRDDFECEAIIGCLDPEFKRRIKTQTVLPPELVEGSGNRCDVVLGFAGFWSDDNAQGGGWRSLNERPSDHTIDLAA